MKATYLGETEWEPDDETLSVFLFRSVRELLFNVVKHAQAASATVTLSSQHGRVLLSVADDGVGCPKMPRLQHEAGFGLFNIRQRLHHLGGTMQIDCSPGQGFRVTLAPPRPRAGPISLDSPHTCPIRVGIQLPIGRRQMVRDVG